MRITGWYVRLERHDPAANRHRHYSLYFEPTLWHPTGALVLRWGRVPGFGNRTGYTRTGAPRGLPDTQARAAAHKLITAKQRRGYQLVAQGQLYVDTVPTVKARPRAAHPHAWFPAPAPALRRALGLSPPK